MWSDEEENRQHLVQAELREYWQSEQEKVEAELNTNAKFCQNKRQSPKVSSRSNTEGRAHSQTGADTSKLPCTLFVSHLAQNTRQMDLESLFERFGPICRTFVSRHPKEGKLSDNSTTYGFVEFEKERDAMRAIQELNGQMYQGNKLFVTTSKNPSKNREMERYRAKQQDYRKIMYQHMKDDEKNLFHFMETYTYMKSLQPKDSDTLPDISQLLHDMDNHPNTLVPAFTDEDYELKINIGNVQKSIIESFAAGLAETTSLNDNQGSTVTSDTLHNNSNHAVLNNQQTINKAHTDSDANLLYKLKGTSEQEDLSRTKPTVSPKFGFGRGAIAATLGLCKSDKYPANFKDAMPPSVGRGTPQ